MMNAPERIYHWMDSQLSLARHYGGCKFNGHHYVIAYDEEGQPLVRDDVLKSERKKVKLDAKAEKVKWMQAQRELL